MQVHLSTGVGSGEAAGAEAPLKLEERGQRPSGLLKLETRATAVREYVYVHFRRGRCGSNNDSHAQSLRVCTSQLRS